MGYIDLKKRVWEANMRLPALDLVIFTWGNVSEADRGENVMAIKPSGVDYEELHPEDIVIVSLETGDVVEGLLRPSSDTATHLELYRAFPEIGGIVHTHSRNAVSWAQAGRALPAYGTTHADYFYGDVPCTRKLTDEEMAKDYEKNTGLVIAETFKEKEIDPEAVPAVLVAGHGPFSWGKDAAEAVYHAKVLEECAAMAMQTEEINPDVKRIEQGLLDKHYMRKHGPGAYYGQN